VGQTKKRDQNKNEKRGEGGERGVNDKQMHGAPKKEKVGDDKKKKKK